jgi:hypothetical protein
MIKKEDGKRVLAFIREQLGTELPKAGLLAGQSITSILLYLYGKSKTIEVNDYDVFLPTNKRKGQWNFRPKTWASINAPSYFSVERFDNFVRLKNIPNKEERFEQFKAALINNRYLKSEVLDFAKSKNDTAIVKLMDSSNIDISLSELSIDDGQFMFGEYNDYFIKYLDKIKYERKNKIVFSAPANGHRFNIGYSINQVFRKGLLNYVFVDALQKDQMTPNPFVIMNYFDLNCVQVSIDLKTEEIYYTRYFEHFLHSGQMIMLRADRPYHSIIRYFNKKEQHGYYGNDELTVGMLNTMIRLKNLKEDDRLILLEPGRAYKKTDYDRNFNLKISEFGDGYREKYNNSKLVKDFYRVDSREIKFNPIDDKRINEHTPEKYRLNKLIMKDDGFDFILNGEHRRKMELTLGVQIEKYPYYAISCLPNICNSEFGVFSSSFSRKQKQLITERKINTKTKFSATLKDLIYSSPDVFSGNIVKSHVDIVDGYLSIHLNAARQLDGKTLSQKYQIIKKLRAIENRHPFTASYIDGADFIDFTDINDDDFEDKLIKKTNEFMKALEKLDKLKEVADLPSAFIDGVSIYELITQGQLNVEHKIMRHCVNGYGGSVRKKMSFIVAFRGEKENATLELVKYNNENQYSIRQFRGIKNKRPSNSMFLALNEYMKLVNPKPPEDDVEIKEQAE